MGRCAGLAACALLIGNQGLQNAAANGDTRTISFRHLHTGESLTVTYKREGRYDDNALKQLNHVMRDWRRNEEVRMDPRVIDVIWEVNREVGGKQPIEIICGYRAPATNQMLRRRSRGVAQHSQHTLGKAVDFAIPGVPLEAIRNAGLRLQRGGVGFYPTSGSPFVHLDVGSVRHWPRMTHDQLARVFPDGRTVHVPSDGRPLAGYSLALADLQKRGSSPSQTSLDAARNSGVQVAEAEMPKRSLLATLFGLNRDDEEDREAEAAPVRAAKPATPARTAAAVPVPVARPALRDTKPAQESGFALASASSSPVRLAAPVPEPAAPADSVFAARGMWEGPQGRPEPPAAIPAPAPIEVASAAPAALPALAPARARADAGMSGPETTSALPAWAVRAFGTDRVPTDIALSYAAAAHNDAPATPPAARATHMGAVVARSAATAEADAATILIKKPQQRPATTLTADSGAAAVKLVVAPGSTYEDPWLRALLLAPNLHNYLTLTAFDAPDPRQLRPLMRKPDSVVMMTFGNDPHFGMTTDRFSGSAVFFVSTVTLSSRTAMLH